LDAVGRECLSKKYNISVEIKQQTSKSMYLCSSPFSPSARTSYLLSPPRRYPPPPAPMPLAAPVPACHYSAIAPSPAVRPLARGSGPMPTHFCRHLQPPVCLLPPLCRPAPTVSLICLSPNRGTLLPLSSLRLPLSTQPHTSSYSPTPSSSSAAHRVLDFPKFLAGVGAGTAVASVRTTIALYSSSIDQHWFTPCSIPSLTLPSSITCSMPNQVELS
jgi:hypothetical protein